MSPTTQPKAKKKAATRKRTADGGPKRRTRAQPARRAHRPDDGVHALFVGAHPDDVELCCGGTILHLVAQKRHVVIVDATRGEAGSRGTARSRAAECRAATRRMGIESRVNLGLPDTRVKADDKAIGALVAEIRRWKPALLVGPHAHDYHPDHVATAEMTARAWFLSGIAKAFPKAGPAHRPDLLASYPGNHSVPATFCVDTSAYADEKVEVIRCYASQIDVGDRGHLVRNLDLLERMKVRDAFAGHQIGVATAEPYVFDGPLPLARAASLMGC